MADDAPQPAEPPKPGKSRKQKKFEKALEDRPKIYEGDLEAAHRKFMMIMIGLGVVGFLLMLFFNQYVDFAVDGGM